MGSAIRRHGNTAQGISQAVVPVPLARPEVVWSPKTSRAPSPAALPPVLRWHSSCEPLNVKGYVIPDPMLYISSGHPAQEEASCIDLSLEVGKPASERAGALGYYPTYSKLSSEQRS